MGLTSSPSIAKSSIAVCQVLGHIGSVVGTRPLDPALVGPTRRVKAGSGSGVRELAKTSDPKGRSQVKKKCCDPATPAPRGLYFDNVGMPFMLYDTFHNLLMILESELPEGLGIECARLLPIDCNVFSPES